jgi:serine/threonine-protein kinase RsbW
VTRTGTITLTIDSQLDHVFLVGQAVNRICAGILMSEQAAYEAEVSVVEAVNNVIKHAYGNQPGHPVEVVVTVTNDSITFKVYDQGVPRKQMRMRLPRVYARKPQTVPESGRGLFIMRAFADAVSYGRDGARNILTLIKHLPGAPALDVPRKRSRRGGSASTPESAASREPSRVGPVRS